MTRLKLPVIQYRNEMFLSYSQTAVVLPEATFYGYQKSWRI
jgi:hypothetical protein